MSFPIIFIVVSIIVAAIDLVLAFKSFNKNSKMGLFLGWTCVFAAIVDLSYLISILQTEYFLVSLFSSVYFACISIMLVCLLLVSREFTNSNNSRIVRAAMKLCYLYMVWDVLLLMTNPIHEKAVHYVYREAEIARYSYSTGIFFMMHLIFSYILIAVSLLNMLRKSLIVPYGYRRQYFYAVMGILIVVGLNAIFLFWVDTSILQNIDFSVWLYSMAAFMLYWSCFNFGKKGMLTHFQREVFKSISQGIILFDYEDKQLMHNDKAASMLSDVELNDQLTLQSFLNRCRIGIEAGKENFSIQCYMRNGEKTVPLRCDYRPLKNNRDEITGRMFVFTDAFLESDLLTSFHNWESFCHSVENGTDMDQIPMGVAICDINGLSDINSSLGRSIGDRAILTLSNIMREIFPDGTYFIRGQDANLMALRYHANEGEMRGYMSAVQARFSSMHNQGMYLNIQYAVSESSMSNPGILQAIDMAEKSMRARKMLDKQSRHSALLTSLIRALQESDDDTEAHVQRTQKMGNELGVRIGLSDSQLSDLSLLCLLHDIGKIGIPLEILNKKGMLSESEWKIMQSHTEKGYQIAVSSKELNGIADYILHHHERWDGKGYPDGLSKESIPLLSRIIAVVDAYDAMVNDRSYRKALSAENAELELKKGAGSQFDPSIVSEFLQMLEETGRNIEVNSDTAAAEENGPESMSSKASLREEHLEGNLQRYSYEMKYARYYLNEKMQIDQIDENFEKITGYSMEDIQKRNLNQIDLIPKEDQMEYLFLVNENLRKNNLAFIEHRVLCKDKSIIYVFCVGRQYYDPERKEARSDILITESSKTFSVQALLNNEYHRAQKRLEGWESKYRSDSLTGLLNQEAFRADIGTILMKEDTTVMMLMMDVDRFKNYNDTYGHRAGDEFLVSVAKTLRNSLRKDDLACRMGGDEFAAALIYKKTVSNDLMIERAVQIFEKVNNTLRGLPGGTSLSVGVAIKNENLHTFNQLYVAADKALYASKESGRACISLSEAEHVRRLYD